MESLTVGDEHIGKIRPSKSDTSLTESFVIVSGNGEEIGEIGGNANCPVKEPVSSAVPIVPVRKNRHSHHILREGKYFFHLCTSTASSLRRCLTYLSSISFNKHCRLYI